MEEAANIRDIPETGIMEEATNLRDIPGFGD